MPSASNALYSRTSMYVGWWVSSSATGSARGTGAGMAIGCLLPAPQRLSKHYRFAPRSMGLAADGDEVRAGLVTTAPRTNAVILTRDREGQLKQLGERCRGRWRVVCGGLLHQRGQGVCLLTQAGHAGVPGVEGFIKAQVIRAHTASDLSSG